eukprot:11924722-Alexandrium_andersonii.AAC.1
MMQDTSTWRLHACATTGHRASVSRPASKKQKQAATHQTRDGRLTMNSCEIDCAIAVPTMSTD